MTYVPNRDDEPVALLYFGSTFGGLTQSLKDSISSVITELIYTSRTIVQARSSKDDTSLTVWFVFPGRYLRRPNRDYRVGFYEKDDNRILIETVIDETIYPLAGSPEFRSRLIAYADNAVGKTEEYLELKAESYDVSAVRLLLSELRRVVD